MIAVARWVGLGAILLLALAAAARALAYGAWVDDEPGPGLFPLLTSLLVACACLFVVAEMRRPAVPAGEAIEESVLTPGRLAIYVAVIAVWPLLLEPLGYVAASAPALLLLLRCGGIGWVPSAVIAVAAVAGSALLFGTLLEVPLPSRRWG